jgi:hypothetical protein
VFELLYFGDKKNFEFFFGKGIMQKWTKFFSDQGITIHTPIESPGRVDKKYFVFKNIY